MKRHLPTILALAALAIVWAFTPADALANAWPAGLLAAPFIGRISVVELRQTISDLLAESKAICETAESEDRSLTDDERKRFDAIGTDLAKAKADLEVMEVQMDRDRLAESLIESADRQRNASRQTVLDGLTGGGSDGRADNFGFESVADFGAAVVRAYSPQRTIDDRLLKIGAQPTNVHQESGADGEGYMVPPSFTQTIWRLIFAGDDLVSMVMPEPTMGNTADLLADESTPWGATGIQAKWAAEGSPFTPSKLATEPRQVRLHKLYAFVLASSELVQDVPRLQNRLTVGASEAIRWKASDAIIYGTGAGQPLGYFNSAALVSVAKEAAQAADTIVAANVAKMLARLLVVEGSNAVWLANSNTLPQLMVMTVGNQPIWTPPAAGFAQAPGGFLLGRPIRLTEHAKTVGDKGDIQLVEPRGYYATQKSDGIQFATSIHLYFDFDVQAFRFTFRLGGQPFLSAPVTPPNTSDTKSHFVSLDERA